jgi:hypothetical protein
MKYFVLSKKARNIRPFHANKKFRGMPVIFFPPEFESPENIICTV